MDEQAQRAALEFAEMPVRIGYLKDMGIDFGWGPTSTVQFMFEHIHVYADAPPFAVSFVLTALAGRLLLFPINAMASDQMARQRALAPVTDQFRDKLAIAKQNGDKAAVQGVTMQHREVWRSGGVKFWRQIPGPILQGLLGFGALRMTRGMCGVPVPGLQSGGFLWFKDLTIPDPYFVLPVAICLNMFLAVRVRLLAPWHWSLLTPTLQAQC